tara:strand:- start:475 stop:801 length:327 start_codon:yes stop_codon:yes gene_type:complete
MGQFIKLPKSDTDLTNFDLMNVSSGVYNITGTTTSLAVSVLGPSVNSAETLPSYSITLSPTMTDSQALDMIQNMSQAVQDVTKEPNSIPTLSMVNGVLVTGITFETGV